VRFLFATVMEGLFFRVFRALTPPFRSVDQIVG